MIVMVILIQKPLRMPFKAWCWGRSLISWTGRVAIGARWLRELHECSSTGRIIRDVVLPLDVPGIQQGFLVFQ